MSDGGDEGSKATVAPAGSKSATAALGLVSEKYVGGGGILILVDRFPAEDEEFVEFDAPAIELVSEVLLNDSIPNDHATTGPESGPHISFEVDAPEADPPESLRYVDGFIFSFYHLWLINTAVSFR